jgi:hypothetical protein
LCENKHSSILVEQEQKLLDAIKGVFCLTKSRACAALILGVSQRHQKGYRGENEMGDYLRTTRECVLDSLHPLLAAAIRGYIEKYELGDIEAHVLMCCETTSTKKKKGMLRRKAEVTLAGIIFTPQWLIWAAGKENEAPGVLSARLHDIRVQDYEKSDMYKLIPDTGLNILGLRTGDGPGSIFFGLGPEPAAQKFRAMLKDALDKA